jgi:hypothetical protein
MTLVNVGQALKGVFRGHDLTVQIDPDDVDWTETLRKCKEKAPSFSAGMNPTLPFTNYRR